MGENITEGRGSSLLGAGLEFGILNVVASSDFSKIDLVKSPPSLALPYPPKVDYGKRIIGMARANKLQKSLFVVILPSGVGLICLDDHVDRLFAIISYS